MNKVQVEQDRLALCLAISPDGRTLAAGCTDGLVYLLGPLSGEQRMALAGTQRGYIRGVAFVPGGNTVAAIGDDNQVRLWDTSSGKLLKVLPALSDAEQTGLRWLSLTSLAVSPDGSMIATGGAGTADGSGITGLDGNTVFELRVQNAKTGQLIWSHLGRRGFMYQLAFSPDGTTLASDTSGDVRLWDARAGDLKQVLKPSSGTLWAIAFSPDNRLLAGCGPATVKEKERTCLTLWDVRSGAIIHSIDAGKPSRAPTPGTLAFSPDGKSLASAGATLFMGRISIGGGEAAGFGGKVINNIKLWDVATGALEWTSADGDYGLAKSVVFSPDGRSVYCCDDSATSRIDTRTGQTRRDLMKASEFRLK
jgi:WD40 repeat protein